MWEMSAKRKGDRKSIKEIGLLLEDKDFHQQIKKGQKDSTGKDARFVLKKSYRSSTLAAERVNMELSSHIL